MPTQPITHPVGQRVDPSGAHLSVDRFYVFFVFGASWSTSYILVISSRWGATLVVTKQDIRLHDALVSRPRAWWCGAIYRIVGILGAGLNETRKVGTHRECESPPVPAVLMILLFCVLPIDGES